MDTIQMIRELSEAFGAPGFEGDVIQIARRYIGAEFCAVADRMNNLVIRKNTGGDGPVVVLDAHADEVGMMVHHIKDDGTMAFAALGTWDAAVLTATKVQIKTRMGEYVNGVIAAKPPHFAAPGDMDRPLAIDSMVIDIGATCPEYVENLGIGAGSPVVCCTPFEQLSDNLILGKAFDCRLGVAAVLEVLDAIKGENTAVQVVGALSAQEEIGIRGAQVVARNIRPDLAIVFEGSPADDTLNPIQARQTRLGHGPMLRHFDAGMITHPGFMRFALDIAREQGIPAQQAVRVARGGEANRLANTTNAFAYHLSNEGVPTIVIGHPVRYIHSPHGIADLRDYRAAIKLAIAIIRNLTPKNMELL